MIAAEIKNSWPLQPIQNMEKLKGGVINDSYHIKTADQKDYVLRVYKNRSPKEIDFEIKLLRHLTGLPIPVLENIQGKYFFIMQNRPAVIYEYLKGSHCARHNKNHRKEVGRFLAYMHIRGRDFAWNGERNKLYDFSKEKSKSFIRAVPDGHPYRERFEEVLKDVWDYALPKNIPHGPIHVDVKPGNVLFSGKKLSGVIDFDNAYFGPLLLDLAKSMVWFGIRNKIFHKEFARDVWEGYQEIRSLEKMEQRNLHRAVRFAFASHLFVDFYMDAIKAIPKSYFDFLMKEFYPAYRTFSDKEAFEEGLGFYK